MGVKMLRVIMAILTPSPTLPLRGARRGFHPSSLPLLPKEKGKLEPPLSARERGGGEGIEHVSEPPSAQPDAAGWAGRDRVGVVTFGIGPLVNIEETKQ